MERAGLYHFEIKFIVSFILFIVSIPYCNSNFIEIAVNFLVGIPSRKTLGPQGRREVAGEPKPWAGVSRQNYCHFPYLSPLAKHPHFLSWHRWFHTSTSPADSIYSGTRRPVLSVAAADLLLLRYGIRERALLLRSRLLSLMCNGGGTPPLLSVPDASMYSRFSQYSHPEIA
jgi:hypothetical protein